MLYKKSTCVLSICLLIVTIPRLSWAERRPRVGAKQIAIQQRYNDTVNKYQQAVASLPKQQSMFVQNLLRSQQGLIGGYQKGTISAQQMQSMAYEMRLNNLITKNSPADRKIDLPTPVLSYEMNQLSNKYDNMFYVPDYSLNIPGASYVHKDSITGKLSGMILYNPAQIKSANVTTGQVIAHEVAESFNQHKEITGGGVVAGPQRMTPVARGGVVRLESSDHVPIIQQEGKYIEAKREWLTNGVKVQDQMANNLGLGKPSYPSPGDGNKTVRSMTMDYDIINQGRKQAISDAMDYAARRQEQNMNSSSYKASSNVSPASKMSTLPIPEAR